MKVIVTKKRRYSKEDIEKLLGIKIHSMWVGETTNNLTVESVEEVDE